MHIKICPSCKTCSENVRPAWRSSRIQELLIESNAPPAFKEADEHRNLLQQRRQLKEEKAELEDVLEALGVQYYSAIARVATVARDLADLKRILRPVRRLPIEVLQHVFVLARDTGLVQTDADGPYFSPNSLSLTAATAPWNVSQVCQLWRKAAVGHPQLWAHVGLDFVHASAIPSQGFWNLLGTQISRACAGPLFVSITASQPLPSMLAPFCMTSAARWKHIKIHAPEAALNIELAPLQSFLQDVEELEIGITDHPD